MFRFYLPMLIGLLIVAVSFGLSEQSQSGERCLSGWQYFQGSCYAFGRSLVTWSGAEAVCKAHGAKLAEIETADENTFLRNMARSAEMTWLGGTDVFKEGYWAWASDSRSIGAFTKWGPTQPSNFENNPKMTWLGATDIFKEGHWIWVSDNKSIESFINWGPRQPNNYGGDPEKTWLGGTDMFSYGQWTWAVTADQLLLLQIGDVEIQVKHCKHCLFMYSIHGYNWDGQRCNEQANYICEVRMNYG